jgi:hypothetical protein
MSIINPPAPAPAQPANVQQDQSQNQNQNINNGFNPESNTSNTNNTTSEASNEVRQQGSLSNYQINNNNSSYFGYANGVRMPSDSLVLSGSISDAGSSVVTFSYVHNIGKTSRKLAEQSVSTHNAGALAGVCANLIKEGLSIDYDLAPEFEKCRAFKAVAPLSVVPTASSELAETKAMLQELIKANKELQRTNEAFQLRILQMQNTPSPIKASF